MEGINDTVCKLYFLIENGYCKSRMYNAMYDRDNGLLVLRNELLCVYRIKIILTKAFYVVVAHSFTTKVRLPEKRKMFL